MTYAIPLWYHVSMKVAYNLRIDEDLKKNLEQMAQEEGRSLNNMINHLLRCAVVSKGIMRRAKVEAGVMLLGKENGK